MRLRLEPLEDRLAPALVTVLNNADSGVGSLRDALKTAKSGDVIDFAANVQSIGLTSLGLTIATNVTVQNDQGAGPVTIDGGGNFTVFTVKGGVTATLMGLTISHGNGAAGGGIANSGALTVLDCTFIANFSVMGGGGIENTGGVLTINDSTFSGNSTKAKGGGIDNNGPLTLSDSTFSDNSAGTSGGGVFNGDALKMSLVGDILVGNTSGSPSSPDDLNGKPVDPSSSDNLVGADKTGSLTNGQNGNQVGVTVAQAGLAPLANNGGPTPTFALLPGSLALGAGLTHAAPAFDQRGVARPVGVPSDVGAFQAVFPPTNLQLNLSAAVTPKGQPVTLTGGFADLRANEPTTATIVWGDGSADTTLTLAAGMFAFNAAHTYAAEGGYFPTVLVANADGGATAGAEVQVLPAAFQSVLDLKGQPGQTVAGAVTSPVSGDVIQAAFTIFRGNVGVGEFLAAQLINVSLPKTPGVLQFVASFDFREHNLSPQDAVPVTLIIRDPLRSFGVPVLLYLDTRTNQEHLFRGHVHFTQGPNFLVVSITFDNAGVPRLVDLTTTVFTVAVAVPGAAVTTAVSAPIVSADTGATAPVQTATFQSSSQLSLTLATTQLGQVSQSLSSLSGGGEADGDAPHTDDALAQLVVKELEALWQSGGENVFRLLAHQPENPSPPAAPGRAPPAPMAPDAPQGKPPQLEGSVDLSLGAPSPPTAAPAPKKGRQTPHAAPAAAYVMAAPWIGVGLAIGGRKRKGRRQEI